MFSVTSGEQLPKSSEMYQWWAVQSQGKLLIEFLSSLEKITPSLDETAIEDIQLPYCGPAENIDPRHAPQDRFMDANNELLFTFAFPKLVDLCDRREIKGLPPNLVGNLLLNRIFPEDWEATDLSNKLTGLDYLSNLEFTRRAALGETAQRLHITATNWNEVLADSDEARSWIETILKQERQVDLYYSSLWVDLRIWSMVKELQIEPFYKPTAIAMLNTLFPPVLKGLPSTRISKDIMWNYRNIFYRFVGTVEANGKTMLDPFIKRLAHSASSRTWPMARKNLKGYIELANLMIKQAAAVHDVSFFSGGEQSCAISKSRHTSAATTTSESSNSLTREISADTTSSEQKSQPPKMVETTSNTPKSGSTNTNPFEQKFVPIPRSKISGRHLYDGYQNFSALSVNSEAAKQNEPALRGASATYWNSGSRRLSSLSDQGSIDKGSGSARIPQATAPRAETPSLEQLKLEKRLSPAAMRLSHEFRNTLPGTPELPSPPHAIGKLEAAQSSRIFHQSHGPDESELLVQSTEHLLPITEPKKSTLKRFGRKQTPTVLPDPVEFGRADQFEESRPKTPYKNKEYVGKSYQDNMDSSLAAPPTLKTKSSFGFLRGRKSRDDARAVSDSNSDRTITNTRTPSDVKLRAKSSLNNLFARKEAGMSMMSYIDADFERVNIKPGENFYNKTIRKARSYGSVKSSSLPIPGEPENDNTKFASSAAFDEDRIITSSDIKEPFPFRNCVQPQTPALLLEKSQDFGYMENKRQSLLEKAKRERTKKEKIGDLERDEEFRKRLEIAQQKRQGNRAEMDPNAQFSQNSKQKMGTFGNGEKAKDAQTPKKKMRMFGKSKDVQTPSKPHTPEPHTPGSGKTPKTPLKERLIKEIANAYSPTARL